MSYTVEMAGVGAWVTGKEIIEIEVVLGSGNNSSSTKVMLSDPLHLIGKALLNHTAVTGGIQALPSANPPAAAPAVNNATAVPPSASGVAVATNGTNAYPKRPTVTSTVPFGTGTVSRGAGYTAEVLAALDAIAIKEVNPGNGLNELGYYNNNQISKGYFTKQDIRAGGGFPLSAGATQNVGRYQFNRADWEAAKKYYGGTLGYSPEDQDKVAYWALFGGVGKPLRGGKELLAGDFDRFMLLAGKEWASIPGSPYGQVQADYTKEKFTAYYQERLAYYKTGKVVATPVTKKEVAPVPAVATPAQTTPVVKGTTITVKMFGVSFEFVHQSTKLGDNGVTEVGGQGVRFILSRRARSKTEQNISLKTLAQKIATAHKVTLDWQATNDPQYSHLDQTGISDYALLKRECDENGLMLTEVSGKLVIKARSNIAAPRYTIARGVNLISYTVEDKAMSGQSTEKSALLTQETTSTIDPVAGKITVAATKDKVADKAVTGKATPNLAGTKTAATEATAKVERARTKRIWGMPATFTVPLSAETVAIAPLDTVTTKGFEGALDRIWLVDSITHKAAANTSVLSCVTPIDSIDSAPAATPAASSVAAPIAGNSKWVYPCTGTVTSPFNPRRVHPISGKVRPHNGWDIANKTGTPIYAVQAGTVTFVGDKGFGGGKQIDLDHGNGYESSYLHNSAILATVGAVVTMGQEIALMGNTGGSTGSHCHLQVKQNKAVINPDSIFKAFATGNSTIGRAAAG